VRSLGRLALAPVVTAALVAGFAGCSRTSSPGRPVGGGEAVGVVAGFYPLQYVAEKVGGERVEVISLAQPGAEPHDLELSPRQVASIVDADLVLYLGGFQPAVDEAVDLEAPATSFDIATGVELLRAGEAAHSHDGEEVGEEHEDEGPDPHVWLDPTRLAAIGDAVADRLVVIDPGHAEEYRLHAATLTATLATLDAEFRARLTTCDRREIMVSHAAFGYLTERYDLEQVALSGIAPDAEPTPRRLAEVADEAQEHRATTIFFESLVSPRVAEAIAAETRAVTAVLDPVEGRPDGGDYLTAMRANLAALTKALGCAA
jgi:zinc transport system substrate-binding protein